jgi:hypothetical protein
MARKMQEMLLLKVTARRRPTTRQSAAFEAMALLGRSHKPRGGPGRVIAPV